MFRFATKKTKKFGPQNVNLKFLICCVFLFWFAWTAAISATAAETNNPLSYRILVFGTCLLFVLLSDLLKVALAGKLRPKLTLKNMIIINRVSGIIILVFSFL